MEIREKIKQGMERWGQRVSLTDGHSWNGMPYRAFLQSLRYKNKLYLNEIQTPLGAAAQDYYLYIGPYDHALQDTAGHKYLLRRDKELFEVIKTEQIYGGDTVCYNWAVVRRMEEAEDVL